MKRLIASTLFGGMLVLACGGATDSDLFGEPSAVSPDSSSPSTGGDAGSSGSSADADAAADSGADAAPGPGCTSIDARNCKSDEYCQLTGCAGTGTCTKKPAGETTDYAPACGCDHVTYWNADLAAYHGVNISALGECGSGAKGCTSDASCGTGGTCSQAVSARSACPTFPFPITGACWVLPSDCGEGGPSTKDCATGNNCTSRCTAIRAGSTYYQVPKCN